MIIDLLILKFMWKSESPRITKAIVKTKKDVLRIIMKLSNSNNASWIQGQTGGQQSIIKSPDTDLRIYESINDQEAINNQCGNDDIQ